MAWRQRSSDAARHTICLLFFCSILLFLFLFSPGPPCPYPAPHFIIPIIPRQVERHRSILLYLLRLRYICSPAVNNS